MFSSSASRTVLVFGSAAALALALVAASLLGSRSGGETRAEPAALAGAAETEALLQGIPQQGITLGSRDAPVTVVQYADLQCPHCARWARDDFPAPVEGYVRPGQVRIVFRGLAGIGPDSESGLRAVLAAGRQGKLWNLVHLLCANQGAENAGWVTDDLVHGLGHAIRGFAPETMLAERSLRAVDAELADAAAAARRAGVPGTPSFEVGPTGGAMELVDAGRLVTRIEQLLGG